MMPSNLRSIVATSQFHTIPITTRQQSVSTAPPQKKQKMSLRQTYILANIARGKMTREASRGDHDLRLLVGHANFLDGLIVDLAAAERDQEMWFNHSVRGAAQASEEPRHVQWVDRIPEEAVEDDDEEEEEEEDSGREFSGNEYDSDDEDVDNTPVVAPQHHRRPSSLSPPTVTAAEVSEDMEIDEDYEDGLVLTRIASHPPELMHESDSDSDDDMMPPSPPQPNLSLAVFSEKQRQAIATTSFYQSIPEPTDTAVASLPPSEQAAFFDDGFYLPPRQSHTTILEAF